MKGLVFVAFMSFSSMLPAVDASIIVVSSMRFMMRLLLHLCRSFPATFLVSCPVFQQCIATADFSHSQMLVLYGVHRGGF